MTSSDPDVIRRQIEDTRANLSYDVDALNEKVNPTRVVDRRVGRAKSSVTGLKDKVFGAAHDSGSQVGGAAHSAAGSVQGAASSAAGSVQGAASSAEGRRQTTKADGDGGRGVGQVDRAGGRPGRQDRGPVRGPGRPGHRSGREA